MASVRNSISSLIIPGARNFGGLLFVAVDSQPEANTTELLLFDLFSVNILDTPNDGEKSKADKRKEKSS